jgi:N-acyl-D-aspartate/D-glutamate deacylase
LKHPASVVTLSHAGAHLGYVCDVGFGLDFLAHWVRDTGHFTLSEGIRKLTIDPAYRFRIPNRGKLQVGALADMLLFNPDEVGITTSLFKNSLDMIRPMPTVGIVGNFRVRVHPFLFTSYCRLLVI